MTPVCVSEPQRVCVKTPRLVQDLFKKMIQVIDEQKLKNDVE